MTERSPVLVSIEPDTNGELRAWDVAAHASAGNDIRFQRAFFLSAHMRF